MDVLELSNEGILRHFKSRSTELCRCCLNQNREMMSLLDTKMFDGQETESKPCDIYFECTGFLIDKSDPLPKSICQSCYNTLQTIYFFKKRCKKIADLLQSECSAELKHDPLDLDVASDCGEDIANDDQDEGAECDELVEAKNEDNLSAAKKKEEPALGHCKSYRAHAELYGVSAMFSEQKCSVCEAVLSGIAALIAHRAAEHNAGKFQCPVCGGGYTTTRGLRFHLRQHSGEKPEVCSHCGRTFSDPRTRINHERLHSGLLPHACSECGRGFVARGLLAAHVARFHPGSAVRGGLVKRFTCHVCGNPYMHGYSLKRHLVSHGATRPLECKCCSKTFTTRSALAMHNLVHTGLKRFACGECDLRVARRSQLVRHLKTHASSARRVTGDVRNDALCHAARSKGEAGPITVYNINNCKVVCIAKQTDDSK